MISSPYILSLSSLGYDSRGLTARYKSELVPRFKWQAGVALGFAHHFPHNKNTRLLSVFNHIFLSGDGFCWAKDAADTKQYTILSFTHVHKYTPYLKNMQVCIHGIQTRV